MTGWKGTWKNCWKRKNKKRRAPITDTRRFYAVRN